MEFTHVVLQLIQITSWYIYVCVRILCMLIVTDRFQFYNSLIITICEEKYYTIPITRRSINRLGT